MKIAVMGATGRVGAKLIELLNTAGHQTVAASRRSGVDVLTGEGLTKALSGPDVVVDTTSSSSFDDDSVMQFFTTATKTFWKRPMQHV